MDYAPSVELLPSAGRLMPPPPAGRYPRPGEVLAWMRAAREAVRDLRARAAVPALNIVTVTQREDRSHEQTQAANLSLIDVLDREVASLDSLARGRFTTQQVPIPKPDMDALSVDIRNAFRRLHDQRRSARNAIAFLGGAEFERDFYAPARDVRPANDLHPATPQSTLRLIGIVGAIGAREGQPFVEFDTVEGTWTMPAERRHVFGLLHVRKIGDVIQMMAQPGSGRVFWAESPPGRTVPPTAEQRATLLHQRWAGALERLAR